MTRESSIASPSRWWEVPPILTAFAEAGVLTLGEVHLAATLVRLVGLAPDHVDHEAVALATALAARAPRFGHVGVDLEVIADETMLELAAGEPASRTDGRSEPPSLPWPDPDTWLDRVAASPLVAPVGGGVAPLVVHAGLVSLERSRTVERAVARCLLDRIADRSPSGAAPSDPGVAATLLTGPGSDRQLAAVASSLEGRLTVLLGGPGTGKTTTVAALVAALIERGGAPVSIALAAPTGKAAARLGEAFAEAAARLPAELAEPLAATPATTIHRLLGTMPLGSAGANRGAFRHHGRNPLPHDIVIVDESSMVSLPLMARLLDALRPDARLVIVGDPDQLASVEAGSVLGDLARAARDGSPIVGCVTRLEHSRRFPPGSAIADLAAAVRAGDADLALSVLADPADAPDGRGRIRWVDRAADDAETIAIVRDVALGAAVDVGRHAAAGEAAEALAALGRVRVLCAHRTGPAGLERWNQRFEQWLGAPLERWYPGRPVLVTENDHRNRLYNGDLGVVIASDGRRTVAFPDPEGVRTFGPARLHAVETTHAMTIHKSQGSEFDEVVVVLPSADSRLATRELLYTAVTRARASVTVVGDAEAVRAAVGRRTVRLSRLADDLIAGI